MIKTSFKTKTIDNKDDYAKFVLEPLDQGYGYTLGNALRRCLLTSIPGAAITKVKIDGVRHQFSTIKGIKEDIVEFLLNLKQVRVIYKGDKEVKLTLNVKGAKKVKAGDIKAPSMVKIVNKKLELMNITDKKTAFSAEIWVNSGYGYLPAEEQKTIIMGIIPVDAAFTPIIRVNYKVEATRVGRRTDLDKLILEVWSDGTVEPKKALDQAAKMLADHFHQVYAPIAEEKVEKVEKVEDNEVLKLTVEELNLPTRIANALRHGGYPTVKTLTEADKTDLGKVKNLGIKSIDIVGEKLKEKGVSFKSK